MLFDREVVRWFRQRAGHLDERLPAGSLAAAARDGLQDSSPWSGALSLHARVGSVSVGAWEDPSLAQVFGPRGAIYLVPRDDVPVFTLGLIPRDPARRAEIEADAERYCEQLGSRKVLPTTRRVRWAGATGRLIPRWDARTTDVSAAAVPDADVEECRRELARGFLHATGPATAAQLQWYTDGSRADAESTLAAIRGELMEVEVGGEARWLLASDEEALAHSASATGVRMLPPYDPDLSRADKELVVSDAARRRELWPKAPPPGAVLVDGEIVGSWRRQGRRVTVTPWEDLRRDEIDGEVVVMPLPGEDAAAEVRWS